MYTEKIVTAGFMVHIHVHNCKMGSLDMQFHGEKKGLLKSTVSINFIWEDNTPHF